MDAESFGRPSSKQSRTAASHPMTGRDPAERNITVPSSAHPKKGSRDMQTRAAQTTSVRRHAARELENKMMWNKKVISDHAHAVIQEMIRTRKDKAYRRSQNMGAITHKSILKNLAENHSIHPKRLLIASQEGKKGTSSSAPPPWFDPRRTELFRVDPRLLKDATDGGRDGICGQFELPPVPDKAELMANRKQLRQVLVLDSVADPVELGQAIRTAVSMMWDAIFVTGESADVFDHECVIAAAGAQMIEKGTTPIHVVRSEDGDDADALLNHIAARNNLVQVCFSPKNKISCTNDRSSVAAEGEMNASDRVDTEQPAMKTLAKLPRSDEGGTLQFTDDINGEKHSKQKREFNLRINDSNVNSTNARKEAAKEEQSSGQKTVSLSQFCHLHFYENRHLTQPTTVVAEKSQESGASKSNDAAIIDAESQCHISAPYQPNQPLPRGHMLIAGPDPKGTMAQRCRQRLFKPTIALTLDEPTPLTSESLTTGLPSLSDSDDADFATSLPVLLYSLRHTAGWKYLPAAELSAANAGADLQTSSVVPDIGPNRLQMEADDLSEQEEEFMLRVRGERHQERQTRMEDKTWSDEAYWVETESKRIDALGAAEKAKLGMPWKQGGTGKLPQHSEKYAPPMYEKAYDLDRDQLKDVVGWAAEYEGPPPNYNLKHHRGNVPWRTTSSSPRTSHQSKNPLIRNRAEQA